MNAFENRGKLEEDEKILLRKALLEYCKLDTLAIVKVLSKLREEVGIDTKPL